MLEKRLISNKILLLGCAVAFCCFLSGCASPAPAVKTADQTVVPQEFEKAAWEDGLLAFKEGDYRKAASIFEALGANARLPEIGRKASYAEASALLAVAHTPEEFARAASVWEQWSRQARAGLEGEDPRMLAPFVWRTIQSGMDGLASGTAQKSPSPKDAQSRNTLQSREKEVETLKIKLEAREREIRRLRHQLESLEEIHRKYQEKKLEASP